MWNGCNDNYGGPMQKWLESMTADSLVGIMAALVCNHRCVVLPSMRTHIRAKNYPFLAAGRWLLVNVRLHHLAEHKQVW